MIKKKSLGQNFLNSPKIVSDIVSAGKVSKKDLIIEIGPGEGVMTEEILKSAGKVIVIEKDHRLIPFLEEKFKTEINNKQLVLVESDILEYNLEKIAGINGPYKVIANIPYYITGQIIRKFLENKNRPVSMTLLVQKEVAERILARDKKESLLSLSVKFYGKPSIIRHVGRGAFTPSPKVDSSVINIENINQNTISKEETGKFFRLIHAGFAHKRKQLISNLSLIYKKEKIVDIFKEYNIDLKARAEDLNLDVWLKINKKI